MFRRLILLAVCLASTHQHFVRAAEICCQYTGCFSDDPPYQDQPLPTCPEDLNPVYTMYTRSTQNNGQVFNRNTIPSAFSSSRRSIFLAHGWQSSGDSAWLHTMKDALLSREDANVVIVDWRLGSELLNYPESAANTRTIGAETALVVTNLRNVGGASNVWCVGHSLGAHVCGNTGFRSTLTRATGMDPAGPWFEGNADVNVGLNPNCAGLVDVIHTDTTYGTLRSLGHLDFYPNGGAQQPGCATNSCSHSRAHQFMEQSIVSDCFLARESCSDYDNIPASCVACSCLGAHCAVMGYGADQSCRSSGMFYVDVVGSAPYCTN